MGIIADLMGKNQPDGDEDLGVMDAVKRHISLDMLDEMSDDEVRESFFSLSTGVERLLKMGQELLEEMQSRGIRGAEGSTLLRALSAVQKSSDGSETDEEGTEKEDTGEEEPQNELTLEEKALKLAEEAENVVVDGDKRVASKVAFVSATPSQIDEIREKPLAGPAGATFKSVYLKEMDLDRDDVLVTHLVPTRKTDDEGQEIPPSEDEIEKWSDFLEYELKSNDIRYVVALGKVANEALGDRADEFVPHPEAVRKKGDSGEVGRKLGRLTDKMDEQRVEKSYEARVVKTDDELQEITGVVMEPDSVDTDGDWAPADEIHKAMTFFMENSQQMKIQHQQKTEEVAVIENWQTRTEKRIGDEMVPAGSWIMTVKVRDEQLWKAAKSGDLNGFSIGAIARFVETDS